MAFESQVRPALIQMSPDVGMVQPREPLGQNRQRQRKPGADPLPDEPDAGNDAETHAYTEIEIRKVTQTVLTHRLDRGGKETEAKTETCSSQDITPPRALQRVIACTQR